MTAIAIKAMATERAIQGVSRRDGARVIVIERGEPGREASHAAAGMLACCDPHTPPVLRPLLHARLAGVRLLHLLAAGLGITSHAVPCGLDERVGLAGRATGSVMVAGHENRVRRTHEAAEGAQDTPPIAHRPGAGHVNPR